MTYRCLLVFLALFTILACNSGNKSDKIISGTESKALSDQVIQGNGILLEVEDSGYPFAYLVIKDFGTQEQGYFDVNLEESKELNLDNLLKLKGQKVAYSFKKVSQNALMDILSDGESIFNDMTYEKHPETKIVEGTLSGADKVTPGDLPGKVTITTPNGEKFDFDYFVTEEMVKVNGSMVTVYYEVSSKQNIITIMTFDKSK